MLPEQLRVREHHTGNKLCVLLISLMSRRRPPLAGTIWNEEDAKPGNIMEITRAQWDALSSLTALLRDAGIRAHAVYDFQVRLC